MARYNGTQVWKLSEKTTEESSDTPMESSIDESLNESNPPQSSTESGTSPMGDSISTVIYILITAGLVLPSIWLVKSSLK